MTQELRNNYAYTFKLTKFPLVNDKCNFVLQIEVVDNASFFSEEKIKESYIREQL